MPRLTDTITVSLLDWKDVIDRTALGFDQLKPPGLAEIAALGTDGRPIAAANAARNRTREVTVDCEHGPVIAIAGRFVHTSVNTTVGALLDGAPVTAQPCDAEPITLPTGQQELLVSPGPQFVVDGAELSGPLAAQSATAPATPAATGAWGPARREVRVPDATTSRVLVVPESINTGWVARTSAGTRLTPLAVNGWQQGWVVPAGTSGTITLIFAPNSLYRAGLAGGLALLPLLALLAWWPPRRRPSRFRCAPVDAGALGRRRDADRRRADRRSGGRLGLRRRTGYAVGAAQSSTTTRRRHLVVERRRADPGRRGVVAASVAIRRRIRGPFGCCATACSHFTCGTGRFNRDAAC